MTDFERWLRAAMAAATEPPPAGLLDSIRRRHRRHLRRVGAACLAGVAAAGIAVPLATRGIPAGPATPAATSPAAPAATPTGAPGTVLRDCQSNNNGTLGSNWQAQSVHAGPVWFIYVRPKNTASSSQRLVAGKLTASAMVIAVNNGQTAVVTAGPATRGRYRFLAQFNDDGIPYTLAEGAPGLTLVGRPPDRLRTAPPAVLLAGCGTALARPGSGPGHPAAGGPGGSRAEAMALTQHLLKQLGLPPGARPAHVRSLPPLLRDRRAPGAGWVSAQRVPTSVGRLLPAPASGVDAAELDVSMAPLSGTTTLVAAYAYAAWLPSRTAAEHLEPASFRAVTISAGQLVPRPHQVTRTFTSAAVIARLAAFLNGRPPAPVAALAALSCPAPLDRFTLRFTAMGRQAPAVAVSTASCMADTVTVNGRQQPLLWDTGGGLASMARKLLGRT